MNGPREDFERIASGLQLCVVKSAPGPVTSPWPVERSAPPWLLPPSAPPATIVLTAPLGSAVPVPPAPPWSDVTLPALDLWAFSYASSLHPSGSTISLAALGPLAPWLHMVHRNKAKRSAKPNFIILLTNLIIIYTAQRCFLMVRLYLRICFCIMLSILLQCFPEVSNTQTLESRQ